MGRAILIWAGLAAALAVPLGLATTSPYLAYRSTVYISAGFAGIVALWLVLVQPVLAMGLLPGLHPLRARRVHRWTGVLLVLAVVWHVAGLWQTSPPDVVDALTFTSPTPFSAYGVVAMWAVFATAGLAVLRVRKRIQLRYWRGGHRALGVVIAVGAVVHALLIEGTMEMVSKVGLCALVLLAAGKMGLNAWRSARRQAER